MSAFDRYLQDEVPPTLETLKVLWTSSMQLAAIAPWKYMSDAQVFVVEPSPGQLFYAHIMGSLGEVMRMQLYQNDAGFWLIDDMLNRRLSPNPAEVFSRTLMMYVDFVRAEELTVADGSAIRLVKGKKQKGSGTPQWRVVRKSCFPWYPSESEAVLLQTSIACSLPFLSEAGTPAVQKLWENSHYIPHINATGEIGRHHLPHKRVNNEIAVPAAVDQSAIDAILSRALKRKGVLEIDSFPSSAQIAPPNSRPYFGQLTLCCDAQSGAVFAPDLTPGSLDPGNSLVKVLLDSIASGGKIPAEVRVRSLANRIRLSPTCEALGTTVVVQSRLPAVDEASAALDGMLSGGM